ncbi:hypothetical protein ACKKBG_A25570 [Auxenochlorella protothecoides x Auxenochlorella symbiontica]
MAVARSGLPLVLFLVLGTAFSLTIGKPKSLSTDADFSKEAFLKKYGHDYGYDGRIDELFEREIGNRLNGSHYLDNTGAALYWNSQVEALSRDLETHAFGNPHSVNPPSLLTDARVDSARRRLLELFGADETTHDLVLTRSGTGALNLLGDAFPWTPESTYAFTRANHNSVLGIRSVAGQYGAQYGALSEEGVEAWLADPEMRHPPFLPGGSEHAGPRRARAAAAESAHRPTYSLFAYPARDNYDGVMYPLKWVQAVQAKSTPGHKWKVLLDAAAFAPTAPLNLTETPADYVILSFYKLFGLPTGVGALIVRREGAAPLRKAYWGGGSVFLATSALDWHHRRLPPASLEDGTLPFLDIVALQYGLDAFERLGGIHAIKRHVGTLAAHLYDRVRGLRHSNGAPLLRVFGKHEDPRRAEVQAATLNFEILTPRGGIYSYRTAGVEAAAAGVYMRLGCTCNPGACYTALGVRDEEVADFAATKHDNWTDWEWITVTRGVGPGGAPEQVVLPLGSIRASLGALSRWEDVDALARFLEAKYVDRPEGGGGETTGGPIPPIDYC